MARPSVRHRRPLGVPGPDEIAILGKEVPSLRRGVGCHLCAGTGYRGRIAVHEIGSDWHVTSPWERRPVDLVAEVDARRVEGLDDNVYGLILRVQPNEDDFYLFAVSSDGQYSVQIRQGGAWQVLQDWEVASAVRGGDQSNHLRVECLGPQMRFWVNEQPVADVQDSTFASRLRSSGRSSCGKRSGRN